MPLTCFYGHGRAFDSGLTMFDTRLTWGELAEQRDRHDRYVYKTLRVS